MEWEKMKKIDWGTILVYFFVVLMFLILLAVIFFQIKADINIIMSKDIPFWLKWKLLQGR